jgi:acyl-CoA hydrolase
MSGETSSEPPAKRVSESLVIMTEHALPNDTNPRGTMFGGTVLKWMDIAGACSAIRHSRRSIVTVAMDQVAFLAPIQVNDIVELRARVVWVGRTSMEVEVDVYAEHPHTGERRHATSALMTFVAMGEDGKATPVPRLILETDEERRTNEIAGKRRALLLETRKLAASLGSER